MFKSRYHDAIVEKNGVFQGLVVWDELVKVNPEQRSQLTIAQMPLRKVYVSSGESILEAHKIMLKEKIDVLPVVDKGAPEKVVCVLTTEGLSAALEKAKNLR
jgi:CBS domain-containing protein